MDVQQAIRHFLAYDRDVRHLSERTIRAYESDLTQFEGYIRQGEPGRVTPDVLEAYVRKLTADNYRATSIRRKIAALKVFFKFLEAQGVVSESPAKRLKAERPRRRVSPKVLKTEEIDALLRATKADIQRLGALRDSTVGAGNRYFCAVRDDVILELLLTTGIRIGELVTLDTDDVDLDERRLAIVGRGERGRLVEIDSPSVCDLLAEYLAIRAGRETGTTALFVARSGGRLTIYSIENVFKKYARRAGIRRRVTPHVLRHTMATRLIGMGADLQKVQKILGHASVLSTRIYTRPNRRRRRSRA